MLTNRPVTNVLFKQDGDLNVIRNKSVAIIGYGSQGRAHALNLRDSGVDVKIGVRSGPSWAQAVKDGFKPCVVSEVVACADVVMLLVPDEQMVDVYRNHVEPFLLVGATLAFAHGFNIHYGQIVPRSDLDVVMIAPKAPGSTVRSTFLNNQGVPHLLAVWRNTTGLAFETALSYAIANGAGEAGVVVTSFKHETETDLFGEQVVLCGGVVELMRSGFNTLVSRGYEPELAYFECVHELKLIVDLVYRGGFVQMYHDVSNNAEFGGYLVGPRVVSQAVQAEMHCVLDEICNGKYAKAFVLEKLSGFPVLEAKRKHNTETTVEAVGAGIRAKLGWLKQ